jgi:hypothetical protein
MRIEVSSIEAKFNDLYIAKYRSMAIDAIESYVEAITAFEAKGTAPDLYGFTDNEAEEFIRSH